MGEGKGRLLDFVLGGAKRVCDVVRWLILGDGILCECCLIGIKVNVLGLVRQAILQFAKAGQQTRPICLDVASLTAQSELNSEPIDLVKKGDK